MHTFDPTPIPHCSCRRRRHRWIVAFLLGSLPALVHAQAGTLDTTFGTNGVIVVPFDAGGDLLDIPTSVIVQADGKVLVAGYVRTATNDQDFAVLRLEANGALDMSFGNAGKVIIPIDLGGGNKDLAEAMAVRPNGSIVLGGYAENPSAGTDAVAVQLQPNGTLDTSFGSGGVAHVPLLFGDGTGAIEAMVLQDDGGVVLVGWISLNATDTDMFLTRILPGGTLDTSFGNQGRTTVFFDLGSDNRDQGFTAALQLDGKIIIAGQAQTSATDSDFAVARLLPNGQLDTSFDGDGRQTIDFGLGPNGEAALATTLQPDNKILLAGRATTTSFPNISAVARLLPNGSLDTTFDGDGRSEATFGGSEDFVRSISTLANGSILLGAVMATSSLNYDFGLMRLTSSGALDTSFAGGSTTLGFDLGGNNSDGVESMAVRNDGRIVLVGTVERSGNTDFDFGIAQFLNDVAGPPRFTDGFESGDTSAWSTTVP